MTWLSPLASHSPVFAVLVVLVLAVLGLLESFDYLSREILNKTRSPNPFSPDALLQKAQDIVDRGADVEGIVPATQYLHSSYSASQYIAAAKIPLLVTVRPNLKHFCPNLTSSSSSKPRCDVADFLMDGNVTFWWSAIELCISPLVDPRPVAYEERNAFASLGDLLTRGNLLMLHHFPGLVSGEANSSVNAFFWSTEAAAGADAGSATRREESGRRALYERITTCLSQIANSTKYFNNTRRLQDQQLGDRDGDSFERDKNAFTPFGPEIRSVEVYDVNLALADTRLSVARSWSVSVLVASIVVVLFVSANAARTLIDAETKATFISLLRTQSNAAEDDVDYVAVATAATSTATATATAEGGADAFFMYSSTLSNQNNNIVNNNHSESDANQKPQQPQHQDEGTAAATAERRARNSDVTASRVGAGSWSDCVIFDVAAGRLSARDALQSVLSRWRDAGSSSLTAPVDRNASSNELLLAHQNQQQQQQQQPESEVAAATLPSLRPSPSRQAVIFALVFLWFLVAAAVLPFLMVVVAMRIVFLVKGTGGYETEASSPYFGATLLVVCYLPLCVTHLVQCARVVDAQLVRDTHLDFAVLLKQEFVWAEVFFRPQGWWIAASNENPNLQQQQQQQQTSSSSGNSSNRGKSGSNNSGGGKGLIAAVLSFDDRDDDDFDIVSPTSAGQTINSGGKRHARSNSSSGNNNQSQPQHRRTESGGSGGANAETSSIGSRFKQRARMQKAANAYYEDDDTTGSTPGDSFAASPQRRNNNNNNNRGGGTRHSEATTNRTNPTTQNNDDDDDDAAGEGERTGRGRGGGDDDEDADGAGSTSSLSCGVRMLICLSPTLGVLLLPVLLSLRAFLHSPFKLCERSARRFLYPILVAIFLLLVVAAAVLMAEGTFACVGSVTLCCACFLLGSFWLLLPACTGAFLGCVVVCSDWFRTCLVRDPVVRPTLPDEDGYYSSVLSHRLRFEHSSIVHAAFVAYRQEMDALRAPSPSSSSTSAAEQADSSSSSSAQPTPLASGDQNNRAPWPDYGATQNQQQPPQQQQKQDSNATGCFCRCFTCVGSCVASFVTLVGNLSHNRGKSKRKLLLLRWLIIIFAALVPLSLVAFAYSQIRLDACGWEHFFPGDRDELRSVLLTSKETSRLNDHADSSSNGGGGGDAAAAIDSRTTLASVMLPFISIFSVKVPQAVTSEKFYTSVAAAHGTIASALGFGAASRFVDSLWDITRNSFFGYDYTYTEGIWDDMTNAGYQALVASTVNGDHSAALALTLSDFDPFGSVCAPSAASASTGSSRHRDFVRGIRAGMNAAGGSATLPAGYVNQDTPLPSGVEWLGGVAGGTTPQMVQVKAMSKAISFFWPILAGSAVAMMLFLMSRVDFRIISVLRHKALRAKLNRDNNGGGGKQKKRGNRNVGSEAGDASSSSVGGDGVVAAATHASGGGGGALAGGDSEESFFEGGAGGETSGDDSDRDSNYSSDSSRNNNKNNKKQGKSQAKGKRGKKNRNTKSDGSGSDSDSVRTGGGDDPDAAAGQAFVARMKATCLIVLSMFVNTAVAASVGFAAAALHASFIPGCGGGDASETAVPRIGFELVRTAYFPGVALLLLLLEICDFWSYVMIPFSNRKVDVEKLLQLAVQHARARADTAAVTAAAVAPGANIHTASGGSSPRGDVIIGDYQTYLHYQQQAQVYQNNNGGGSVSAAAAARAAAGGGGVLMSPNSNRSPLGSGIGAGQFRSESIISVPDSLSSGNINRKPGSHQQQPQQQQQGRSSPTQQQQQRLPVGTSAGRAAAVDACGSNSLERFGFLCAAALALCSFVMLAAFAIASARGPPPIVFQFWLAVGSAALWKAVVLNLLVHQAQRHWALNLSLFSS